MSRSGVKGTALESVVLDVNRLVENGTIKLDVLEARMTSEDMAVLESKIQPALWYPLDSFGRMTALLLEYEGHGDTNYLRKRGRLAADRIGKSGIYNQLKMELNETYGDRLGRMMVTLGPAMYRDTVWSHETILDAAGRERIGFRIVMISPVDFPDICRHSTHGFIEFVAERAINVRYVVTCIRRDPRTVVFEGRQK